MPVKKKKTTRTKVKKSPNLKDISNDLNDIFLLLKKNFDNAWQSEEKKKIEKELKKGVSAVSKKLETITSKTKTKAKEGEEVALSKLHEVLQKTANTLKKSSKSWKSKK